MIDQIECERRARLQTCGGPNLDGIAQLGFCRRGIIAGQGGVGCQILNVVSRVARIEKEPKGPVGDIVNIALQLIIAFDTPGDNDHSAGARWRRQRSDGDLIAGLNNLPITALGKALMIG